MNYAVNEPLRKTLTDVAKFLDDENVPFAVIGGIAVSYRGEPRVTADVGLVIGVGIDRAIELLGVLES